MINKKPIYNDYQPDTNKFMTDDRIRIKVADCVEDIMKVISLRSAVFISEQECPYQEEFDGNDFCSSHLIAFKNNEPIACIRVRYFGSFAKMERLAVRHEYRKATASYRLVKAAIELARKKGFTKIYGHAQERLVNFWARFGAKKLPGRPQLVFSDFSYTEMLITPEPHEDPITIDSDPYLIIRSEGRWDEVGVLEKSSMREVSSPLKKKWAA